MFAGESTEPQDAGQDDASNPEGDQAEQRQGTRGEGRSERAQNPAAQPVVETTEQLTRGRISGALEDGHEEGAGGHAKTERQKNAERVLEQANHMHEKMETLQEILAHQSTEAKAVLKGAALQTWLQMESFIVEQAEKAKLMRSTAWEISEWETGNRSPAQLLNFLQQTTAPGTEGSFAQRKHNKEYRKRQQERDQERRGVLHAISGAMAQSAATNYNFSESGDPWEVRNHASKIMAIGMVNQSPLSPGEESANIGDYLTFALSDIDDKTKAMEGVLKHSIWEGADKKQETMEEFLRRIGAGLRDYKRLSEEQGKAGGFREGLRNLIPGVQFYSIYEVMEAITKVKDAYIQAYKERSSLRTDILAQQIGAVASHLPWGGADVPHTLESRLDEANDKVKDHHADHLKKNNVSYKNLFNAHGELAHNAHDGNRARGVLEYAASRGWLYDIDLDSQEADGILKINGIGCSFSLRELVPKNWNETKIRDYQSILLTKQNSGKKDEEKKYYDRYYNKNQPGDFIKLADEELEKVNLWGVTGIIKRSLERGLAGEISPWIAATLMRHLEKNETVRRVATLDWLDQTGQLAFYSSHFTAGFFKGEKKEMLKWLKEGDPENPRDAGIFGTTIMKIREEIGEKTGKVWSHLSTAEQKEMEVSVAKIMAGQLVEIDGKRFTIFSDRYANYRNHKIIEAQGDLNPSVKDEDPDYYMMRAENRLAGSAVVKQIFARTGQGSFQHEEKVPYYAADIIGLYDELAEAGMRGEAENFRKEMGRKLSEWILDPLGDARSPGLETRAMKGRKELEGEPIIGTLLKRGFIDIRYVINKYVKNKGGFAELVLDQNAELMGHDLFKKLKQAMSPHDPDKIKAITEEWRHLLPEVTWIPPLKISGDTTPGREIPQEELV